MEIKFYPPQSVTRGYYWSTGSYWNVSESDRCEGWQLRNLLGEVVWIVALHPMNTQFLQQNVSFTLHECRKASPKKVSAEMV